MEWNGYITHQYFLAFVQAFKAVKLLLSVPRVVLGHISVEC